jgi:hypothetical protein
MLSSSRSSRSVSPKEGKNIDILYAENVACKFCRILKKLDIKYLDLLFVRQCIYIPNAVNNSLTIISHGEATPRVISTGCLYTWTMKNETEEPELGR